MDGWIDKSVNRQMSVLLNIARLFIYQVTSKLCYIGLDYRNVIISIKQYFVIGLSEFVKKLGDNDKGKGSV